MEKDKPSGIYRFLQETAITSLPKSPISSLFSMALAQFVRELWARMGQKSRNVCQFLMEPKCMICEYRFDTTRIS